MGHIIIKTVWFCSILTTSVVPHFCLFHRTLIRSGTCCTKCQEKPISEAFFKILPPTAIENDRSASIRRHFEFSYVLWHCRDCLDFMNWINMSASCMDDRLANTISPEILQIKRWFLIAGMFSAISAAQNSWILLSSWASADFIRVVDVA